MPFIHCIALHARVQESTGSSAADSSSTGMPVFEFQRERSRLLGVVEAARLRVDRVRQAERTAERRQHEDQQRQLAEAKQGSAGSAASAAPVKACA